MKESTLSLVVRVVAGWFNFCSVLHLCSLSTYDIVVTTYSLLAKEIPTKKPEGKMPGANLSVEVRRGCCQGSRVGTADCLTGVFSQHQRWQRYPPVRS